LPENVDGPMKIYVGGLTENLADITDSDIRSIFHPFGEIDSIDLPKDPLTGKSRGYCFITYRKTSQAKAAMNAMNGFYYKGKILKVF
jgi:RNA-binding protein 39